MKIMGNILNQDRDAAVAELEAAYQLMEGALLVEGYRYVVTDDPTINLDDYPDFLRNVRSEGNRVMLTIYNGNSDTSVYSDPQSNIRFRFIHDVVHLENNLGFSFDDEMKVAQVMFAELEAIGVKLSDIASRILTAETAGMNLYAMRHNSFPVNQAAFIDSCLNKGQNVAVIVKH
jgi:hypothetical protein